MNRLVIGLGTGRCGTKSLSFLLSLQDNSLVYHEWKDKYLMRRYNTHILPWKVDYEKYELKRKSISEELDRYKIFGDVAFYYLNYVEYIKEDFDDVKFIVMKRDKLDTILSYDRWTGKRNLWTERNSRHWDVENDIYDPYWYVAYPHYNARKTDAIGLYYEEYYNKINKLMVKYPNDFLLLEVDELNNENVKYKLSRFLGIPDFKYLPFWKNRTR